MSDGGAMENYAYIGDGVYAFFDGFGIWLRTGNHSESLCDNQVYLEPNALRKLNIFIDEVRNK